MHIACKNTFKLVKIQLNVAIRKTDVTNWLLLNAILTSKKEKQSFFSHSEVNFMFGCSFNSQNCLNVNDKGTLQKYNEDISKRPFIKYQGHILRASVFQNDMKMHLQESH